MFGISGSKNFATSLQAALISAAGGDNFHPNKRQHDSGWGGVWYSENNQGYFRTKTPIFKDSYSSKFFETVPEVTLTGLSHARLASDDNFNRGPFDSHPFVAHVDDELVYVSHNGEIDKSRLTEYDVENGDILNDSEFFTYLLEKCRGDSVKERLDEAAKMVRDNDAMKSALNLIVLTAKRTGEKKIYYFCDYRDRDWAQYYSMYTVKTDQGCAVMSSTVACKAGFTDENGTVKDGGTSKCEVRKVLSL